jgi:cytochrome P450
MVANEHRFARHADVVAALADPALVPVEPTEDPLAEEQVSGTAAWLRGNVARFAHGSEHARRRAFVEAEVARIDDERLRQAASAAARKAGAGADPRFVVVCGLAEALGLPDPDAVAADVAIVSGVYFGGSDPAADAAVARLVLAHRTAVREETDAAAGDEEIANRISLLIQAFEATGTLVERARRAEAGIASDDGALALLLETLRHDPPVLAMRRTALRATSVAGVAIAAGDLVTLDIAAANRDPEVFDRPDEFDVCRRAESSVLTYGSEPRRCPGRRQSLVLAAAVLEADHV